LYGKEQADPTRRKYGLTQTKGPRTGRLIKGGGNYKQKGEASFIMEKSSLTGQVTEGGRIGKK